MEKSLFKLLEKYDLPGPRYTSYPTVPAWTEEVGREEYKKSLGEIGQAREGQAPPLLSLYFHIPFCETLCHFCGCMTVITKEHDRSRAYVNLLLKEIDLVADRISKKPPVTQLHFGGGSPNFLKPEELKEILQKIRSRFALLPDAEIAIEMHPKTSRPEFCKMLAELRFNRISMGVQDFDPKVQQLINRHQTYEMTEEMISLLRSLGFRSFNFDLIYGLPGQTMTTWEETLSRVLKLRPDRLAVYSYAHVPWLKTYQRSFEDKDLPSPRLKLELFEKAYQQMTKNGYRPIGMDHFCLEGDDLSRALETGTIHRNFMGYSTKAEAHQIGFGVSAISYAGGDYFQNQKELPLYEKSVSEGKLATYRGFLLSEDDKIRRDWIRRLMCTGKIDFAEFSTLWKIDVNDYFKKELRQLDSFVKDRLLKTEANRLQVVGEGFLFLRNIAMVFDRYLEGIREKATTPVFSKTI